MVAADMLKQNSIKGIYDDTDIEPYDEENAVVSAPSIRSTGPGRKPSTSHSDGLTVRKR